MEGKNDDKVLHRPGGEVKTIRMNSGSSEPVTDKIDLVVDGHTFRREKSNPRIYSETLDALEVRAPEASMIGDEAGLDVALPKSLGMRAILLERPGKASARGEIQPDAGVKDLNGAIDVIIAWPQVQDN